MIRIGRHDDRIYVRRQHDSMYLNREHDSTYLNRQHDGSPTSRLPNLPREARLKFDHLSFREPGNTFAEERLKKLKEKTAILAGKEKDWKRELEELIKNYMVRTEVEEAGRSQFRLKLLQEQNMRNELRKLCWEVGRRFEETKRALEEVLISESAPNESKTPEQLERIRGRLARIEGKLKMEKLRQGLLQRDLTREQDRLKELQGKKGSEPERPNYPVDDKDGESSSSDSEEPTSDVEDDKSEHSSSHRVSAKDTEKQINGLEEETTAGLNADAPSGKNTGTEEVTDIQDTQEKIDREVNGEESRQTVDQVDAIGRGSSEYKEDGESTRPDGFDGHPEGKIQNEDGGDPKTNGGGSGLEDLKSEQEEEDAAVREKKAKKQRESEEKRQRQEYKEAQSDLERKIAELNVRITKNTRALSDLEEDKENTLDQQREWLEKESEDKKKRYLEEEHNKEWQEMEERERRRELNVLEEENRRQDQLELVRRLHSEEVKDAADPYAWRRRASPHYYRRRRRPYYDDDSDVEPDTKEKIHLEAIQKMIDQVDALEKQVGKIRELKEQIQGVAISREVLEYERNLEDLWSKFVSKPATTAAPAEDATSSGKDHFSGDLHDKPPFYENPLGPDETRIMILWPAKEISDPLICTVETETWDRAHERGYAALSYHWGPDKCNGRIYLVREGHAKDFNNLEYAARHATRIPVRNNLFRALLRLRHPEREVALWVDAICVDQSNMTEKTERLGQMVKVYRKAKNVCVWLGESDAAGKSDEAMKFIRAIMDFAVLDRYARDKGQAKNWNALAELMRDRWFSRRWVVQEISLALDKATIHCGGEMVHWADFADAVSLLVSNQEVIKDLFDESEFRHGRNTLGDVHSFGAYILLEATSKLFLTTTRSDTAQVEITKSIKSLESLVTSLKTFDASDPRDLIYSLVYITSDTGSHAAPKKRPKLEVDYKKQELEVYTDFTTFCILSSKSLDIICRPWAMPIKTEISTDKLPSWIPLLSRSEFGEPEHVYTGRKNGENLVGSAGNPRYKASGRKPYKIKTNTPITGTVLRANGFVLAEIEKTSARNTGGLILRESLEMGSWTGIQDNTTRVPDKIWRTLVADRDPDGQFPPTWYQRACLRCLEIADAFNNGDLNVGELLQGHSEMLRKYLTRVRNVTWNRRFFHASTTPKKEPSVKQGDDSLFGLGPPGTKEKDLVCILYGCSVPVVLRRSKGDSMVLVGEAYVHGKMEGEAIQDMKEGKTWSPERWFDLD